MKDITISVRENRSERVKIGNLVLSLRGTSWIKCEVVVGSPGLPNIVQELRPGDAVLFESLEDGMLEIRALTMDTSRAEFLITQISPRSGLRAGIVDDDPNNLLFTPDERAKITESIARIEASLSTLPNTTPEQLRLISRKLDEIGSASERLGRKDWTNYVAGTLTSICISAAFAPETTKAFFMTVNSAFQWLFNNMSVLIS